MKLFGLFRPKASAAPVKQAHEISAPSRDAGSFRGSFFDWRPRRTLVRGEGAAERRTLNRRIEDLYANDGTAKSAVDSLATNICGTGLEPQPSIPWQRLGISREQAQELQERAGWLWYEWERQADYRDQVAFPLLQNMAVRSLIKAGEFVHLPVVEKRPRAGCRFRLRIQSVSPDRLMTPYGDEQNPYMHDGVEVSETGIPQAYWIASPKPSYGYTDYRSLTREDFMRIPARMPLGRKGIFHVFCPEQEEQYRGVSVLAPVVAALRRFSDSIDNELAAQVMASSFPIFVSLANGPQDLPNFVREQDNGPEGKRYYQAIEGGQILYGNEGEKPEVLESSRPSQNFLSFCELILRQTGAALGIPYEVLTKDFSKTNYSSARAALLEAWRVYDVYRRFFVRQYCQPIYEMVMDEAYLGGFLELPCSPVEYFANRTLWTNARWNGPSRGYVDPLKEAQAQIALINAGLMSRSDAIAERGGDFDEVTQSLGEEAKAREAAGLGTTGQSGRTQEPTDA